MQELFDQAKVVFHGAPIESTGNEQQALVVVQIDLGDAFPRGHAPGVVHHQGDLVTANLGEGKKETFLNK